MKKVFLLVLLMIGISCNSEDSNDNGNSSGNQNTVSKIVTTTYAFGEPQFINSKFYSNNKPVVDSIYNVPFDTWIYKKFFYENDRLVLREQSSSSSNQINEFNITYDSLGRIIQTENISDTNSTITTFSYTDQIITSESNTNGEIIFKEFHLNNDDLVYKEVGPEETLEIEFDEDYNVLSFQSSIEPTIVNTYDNTSMLPIDAQLFENFIYGEYKNNYAFSINDLGGINFSFVADNRKYHLSASDGSFSFTYQWTINTNGYPSRTDIFNSSNQLITRVEYFYD